MEENILTNKTRIKSIIMSGEKCSFGKTSIKDCHCNDCHNHIVEYLGKKLGNKYIYTGNFQKELKDREIEIIRFSTDEDEETSSCECFIKLTNSDYTFEWIPRKEILNNLKEAL